MTRQVGCLNIAECVMRIEDMRALTRAAPFRPFRVYLTNGETYDIHHPDMLLATLGAVHIAAPTPGGPPNDGGSVRIVSLVHIVKIEYLPPVSPVNSNGPPG
jgi:hypothetical protein